MIKTKLMMLDAVRAVAVERPVKLGTNYINPFTCEFITDDGVLYFSHLDTIEGVNDIENLDVKELHLVSKFDHEQYNRLKAGHFSEQVVLAMSYLAVVDKEWWPSKWFHLPASYYCLISQDTKVIEELLPMDYCDSIKGSSPRGGLSLHGESEV